MSNIAKSLQADLAQVRLLAAQQRAAAMDDLSALSDLPDPEPAKEAPILPLAKPVRRPLACLSWRIGQGGEDHDRTALPGWED